MGRGVGGTADRDSPHVCTVRSLDSEMKSSWWSKERERRDGAGAGWRIELLQHEKILLHSPTSDVVNATELLSL